MAKKNPFDYGLVQLAGIAAFAGGALLVASATEGAWQALALPGGIVATTMVGKLAESMINDIENDE